MSVPIMLDSPKLVLDTLCEVYELIRPFAHSEFQDLAAHEIVPGATYLIGKNKFYNNKQRIRELVNDGKCRIILSNPLEGSHTIVGTLKLYGMHDLVIEKNILIIGGGEMGPEYHYLQYDSFATKIELINENRIAALRGDEIFSKTNKPYKFLFLNGRGRPHRKYLLERFRVSELLDQALWTWLDSVVRSNQHELIKFIHNGQDLLPNPLALNYLPYHYEVDRYRDSIGKEVVTDYPKKDLFNNEWGDVYVKAEPYIDTYFSLVTETVFTYPYSFRTEKIWKPVFIGHPWICAANKGFYRDIHDLGFKTFGHVIDESFDHIDNNQDRIQRIAEVVEDLCQQDLDSFLKECYNVCKYNQQHMSELRIKVQREFPERFFKFLKHYDMYS